MIDRFASLAAIAALALAPACTTRPPADDDAPKGAFEVVPDWPRIPEGKVLGTTYDVAIDSRGRVFVAHTGSYEGDSGTPIPDPTIFVFDPDSGELLDAWGEGLFVTPHGVAIDRDDNVWVTDSGQDLVFKLDPSGRVLMTIGGGS